VLVAATAGCLQLYGARLRSLALFGSGARLDYGSESDIDLLAIADPLPEAPGDRLAELEPLAEDCQRLALESHRRGDGFHAPQFVPWTPAQVAAEPPLLLDLTEDADVLFDPDRVLSGALESLREKLRRHGARRAVPVDGPAYWLLHPGARVGEVVEL
jgi:hypothetical protein